MKKIFIVLTLLLSTSLISCSSSFDSSKNTSTSTPKVQNNLKVNSKSKYIDYNKISNEPITIDSNSLTPSSVITNNDNYLLINKIYNNKIYNISQDVLNKTYDFKKINASNLVANSLSILGDTVLFSNGLDGGSIYSFKLSEFNDYNVEIKKLTNSNSNNFISTTKGVYYINQSDENKLYRINEDGTENIAILQDSCGQYSPHDSWIIYENASDKFKLYAINIDTNVKTKLTDFSVESFAIANNIVYATNAGDNNHIYRIDLSTKETKKFFDLSASDLLALNNNLIFKNNNSYNELFKINLNQENISPTNLNLGSPNEYFLGDDKIFFIYPNKTQNYLMKDIKSIID